ncbi:MAG: hypothetical protein E7648_05650 [Ruminococcaceae bacterium]|nr:hypothetical protein [Oscillospiraceae bacterium]
MKSSAKEMVMFRNSRKGYDKNDVNRYIEDMNIRFTTAENRYISTVRMLEQDIEKYKADAGKAGELESAKRELGETKAKLAELENELASAKDELLKAKAEFEEKLANAPKEEVKTELSITDTESKLGSILVKANLDAQKILSDAEEESRRKIAEAEKAADSIRFDAAVKARIMTETTRKELAALTEEYMKNLNALSVESAEEYKRLSEELKARFEQAESAAKEKLNF